MAENAIAQRDSPRNHTLQGELANPGGIVFLGLSPEITSEWQHSMEFPSPSDIFLDHLIIILNRLIIGKEI